MRRWDPINYQLLRQSPLDCYEAKALYSHPTLKPIHKPLWDPGWIVPVWVSETGGINKLF